MTNKTLQIISPGRVNLLGEHVDKNDGLVLPAAIDRSIKLNASARTDQTVQLRALDLNQSLVLDLNRLDDKVDNSGRPLPTWALYPAGVAWSLKQAGYEIRGAEVEFTSNIPMGAGLSSSAAVEVGFAVMWQALAGWSMNRLNLSKFCQKAEVEYAGVNCGLMDQFACANGVEGHAVLLDTRSLDFRPVPLPKNTSIVIADSSVRRSLVTSAYNERVEDCKTAVKIVNEINPAASSLRDVSIAELTQMKDKMPFSVFKHARHVVDEIARVDQAIAFLEQDQPRDFGQLMFETHVSLRDLYEVSCPELDCLVEIASSLQGCIGARLTGAGFGGCTVNLVEQDHAESFARELAWRYNQQTSRTASVFITQASRGAHVQ